jgi:hypothetical protein
MKRDKTKKECYTIVADKLSLIEAKICEIQSSLEKLRRKVAETREKEAPSPVCTTIEKTIEDIYSHLVSGKQTTGETDES